MKKLSAQLSPPNKTSKPGIKMKKSIDKQKMPSSATNCPQNQEVLEEIISLASCTEIKHDKTSSGYICRQVPGLRYKICRPDEASVMAPSVNKLKLLATHYRLFEQILNFPDISPGSVAKIHLRSAILKSCYCATAVWFANR
ncbi:hypothetical protein T11_15285 [Trichinella zimbabwensis]|uniref:Uncharacterized protein n=1 Tax=Trichinella zimbabwensis TaxID=268475 RepID=A0A0V1GM99_9BILA|nr:hypothetical protein T11_15285 [Trichinella zimbabwensis]